MIKLFVDGRQADIDAAVSINISLSVASLTKIESAMTGYSKTFLVPITAVNMRIMGDVDQINCVQMFNSVRHEARVEADGFTVMEGALRLVGIRGTEGVTDGGTRGWYECNIIGSSKLWVQQAAESMFNEIEIEYETTVTENIVRRSWTEADSTVRFLPVQRNRYTPESSNNSPYPVVRVLSFEDYHPFLNVKKLFDAIMGRAGYTIRSRFMESEYFRALYISGNYHTRDIKLLRERMDFMAGRFSTATATANTLGRIYADPTTTLSSLGNIVDTADPKQIQDSKTLDDVFTINNCFKKVGSRVVFTPMQEVTMGFEYRLRYTTDYRIATREELCCFNSVNLGDQQMRTFKVPNSHVDRRGALQGRNMQYSVVVFGHVAGNTYQVRYKVVSRPGADPTNPQPGDLTDIISSPFSARLYRLTFTTEFPIYSATLYRRNASTNGYEVYPDDWAMYDGYINETGTKEVEVVICSRPEIVSPGSPKYFDRIYFEGGEPGWRITLADSVTIRPIFMSNPGEGSQLTYADVAAHQIRQIEFVNSIRQMFNLYFYTDNFEQVVYIEPRPMFYCSDTVVDWSDKVDYSYGVCVEELGADMTKTLLLGYRDLDSTVARWNGENDEQMGQWSASIDNVFASDSATRYINPLFAPSRNSTGYIREAESASMMQVGDNLVADNIDGLNFPPKVALYPGMMKLPAGERWGWPGYGSSAPFVAFHHEGYRWPPYAGGSPNPQTVPDIDAPLDIDKLLEQGVTLCFEDRDSVSGLHRYYDDNIVLYNSGKRVTLYLDLRPQDVEPLIRPNRLKRDFRALFRLRVGGEYALFRLEQICDYNPSQAGSTKCVFIKNV